MNLSDIGWNDYFESLFHKYREKEFVPFRVSQEHKSRYVILGEKGDFNAEISGKFRHEACGKGDFPAVGDWVAVSPRPDEGTGTIHAVLPRKSAFSRKVAGKETEEQVVAANIDTVFLVSGLDNEFNPRRIERYLTLSWECGAKPVIVLNKSDLCEDIDSKVSELESISFGVPILTISARNKTGLDDLRNSLNSGMTAAFLGSSGVGKSTIINGLLGYERQFVNEVREDDSRGRHTTTYRELILLPAGGILVDTPGMREIQLWGDESGLSQVFDDIEAFASQCKFRDCSHNGEPGCAIEKALEDGSLDKKRWSNYRKLQKELRFLAVRQDKKEARRQQREWDKKIRQYHQQMKELRKRRGY
ncbi:MAG: ribosome small subunit-dependent GTPase A [candidate division Zixibacteria bacterium]|nr:ribosome small subunit-dependent GTPase A [candidate division Zixibacteria bacterium]NIR65512.1 ribosome small subunit-dependent GTPase A [candidate division Zixibacteria bacterium]NIS15484.1 ribosome small subunit-dependent GTPase A [candidate division Zixibacteria bacterium]NIS47198.1 ribosome small subunit-dependent GTPase A [candidate division Zixibacteria bacterium]NIT52003.1 ribosome small subunit-dependent GTPase A [candidate division Zixibacteria bacterium]